MDRGVYSFYIYIYTLQERARIGQDDLTKHEPGQHGSPCAEARRIIEIGRTHHGLVVVSTLIAQLIGRGPCARRVGTAAVLGEPLDHIRYIILRGRVEGVTDKCDTVGPGTRERTVLKAVRATVALFALLVHHAVSAHGIGRGRGQARCTYTLVCVAITHAAIGTVHTTVNECAIVVLFRVTVAARHLLTGRRRVP